MIAAHDNSTRVIRGTDMAERFSRGTFGVLRLAAAALISACSMHAVRAQAQDADVCGPAFFCESFEDGVPGQLPGAPWSEETYGSGALIAVSRERAFNGRQSLHAG